MATSDNASVKAKVSESEWRTRVDLAACYRLLALFGWTDLLATHVSARLPDEPEHYLLNPYGLMFDEITASSLLKLDYDGNVLDRPGADINRAGHVIHGAVLAARPDVGCALHTHTRAGLAVSAQADGLLPITQTALRFYDNLAYHDYEGIALDAEERASLAADLGPAQAMILRNHGLLTAGRNVAEAFILIHDLELACQSQIDAQAGNGALRPVPREVCEKTAAQYRAHYGNRPAGGAAWAALRRRIDRIDPSYRT